MQAVIEENAKLLRELRARVQAAFRDRHHNEKAAKEHSRALHEFNERYDELAFPGGLRSGLRRIEAGDLHAVETAIRYLEIRPFYYRAQFNRIAFARRLKRLQLPPRLASRFAAAMDILRAWGVPRNHRC